MPKIVVNYTVKGNKIKIHKNPIYADLPLAFCDLYDDFKEPLIIPTGGVIPRLVEKEEYLKTHKKFFFEVNEDCTVREVDEKEAKLTFYYPKDTDIQKLRYINGQILLEE